FSTYRRGLNPPHRVKSISMTTFTQQEIEYLQKHGNEVCKRIWLSLYDDRTTSVPDFREPQKVKEFLQEKYEKKRWHVPPEQAKPAAPVHASISGSSNNSSTSSTPEVRPLKSLLGESAPSLHLNKNTPPNQSPVVSRGQSQQQQQPFHDKRFDLLSELGGDIFAAPPNMNAGASSSFANFAHFNSHTTAQSANANANFANFDAFGSTSGSSGGFPSAPQAQFQPSNTGRASSLHRTHCTHPNHSYNKTFACVMKRMHVFENIDLGSTQGHVFCHFMSCFHLCFTCCDAYHLLP
ncbi:arf-GAP domain and FG repeat-containing protein 1-like, partial [Notothenia coriiceps]|uniref:Arf-GAP domain and FG repeat-containing protein 1-like n=1 Tax=Notothenia coriiceps TaxID=8208 RepID=A0A6I9PT04_9TELE